MEACSSKQQQEAALGEGHLLQEISAVLTRAWAKHYHFKCLDSQLLF